MPSSLVGQIRQRLGSCRREVLEGANSIWITHLAFERLVGTVETVEYVGECCVILVNINQGSTKYNIEFGT